MKNKPISSPRVQWAFGLAIVILLGLGAISYRGMLISAESDLWVRHTHEVLENLDDLLVAMGSIESGYRGFVLTGEESYLEFYQASILGAQQHESMVRSLTRDNPVQQSRGPELERLITQKIEFGDRAIQLRRDQGLEAAANAIHSGSGQRLMQEFHATIRAMEDEERRLLVLRDAEAKRRLGETKAILILGTVLGLLTAVGARLSIVHDSSGRGRAEAALWDSEEKYRMVLELVQEYAIFTLDPKGRIVSWNAGAERIKGYTAEEIIGRNYSCFFLPEDIKRGKPEEILRMTAAIGQHEEHVIRVRKDGSRFLARVTFSALRDHAGKLRGFSEISRDLSESKESEARYRGLLEAAPDGMVVVNQGGEIVLLNVQAEKQFGYRRDELVREQVTTIIPEGFAERLAADALRSSEDARAQQMGTGIELIGRRKDGSKFPIEIMLSPLESTEGILVTAAIRDISVRKAAEKHLAHMEARYRGLLEAAPDAMVVVDTKGEIVLLNVRAEKQFGYRRDELVGTQMKTIIPEGFAERLIADALRSTEDALAQQIGTGIELTGRRKDGSEFPIEIMLSPLASAEGILVTAAIRDISMRKTLERQFWQAQKLEAVGRLAGGVAHDFNNVLMIVGSYADLILDLKIQHPKLNDYAKQIRDAGTKAATITHQLLAFSRKQMLEPEVLDANSVVRDLGKILPKLLGENIEFVTTLDPSVHRVKADRGQLEQIVMNLAVNARDSMNNGGRLIIETRNVTLDTKYAADHPPTIPGDYVMLSVTDNGTGMDADTKARIFEPFFTTKERGKGTGLGLATVYGIVKQSGGFIWLNSEPGKGSSFEIYLPPIADLPSREAMPTTDTGAGGSETILVVEDEALLRNAICTYLQSRGYEVLHAADGADALSVSENHKGNIDALLTDLVMPGLDGVEVGRAIQSVRPGIRILYMSGYHERAVAGLEPGSVLLRKPSSLKAIAQKLREVLDAGLTKAIPIAKT